MKIFRKQLKEYLLPIKYYMLVSVIAVIFQYIMLGQPFEREALVITQIIWATMIAVSVVKLVKYNNFRIENLLVIGIIYSLIIHGLKVSIRVVFFCFHALHGQKNIFD